MVAARWQAVLVELLAVLEDIFRNLSKVEIEVATHAGLLIDERVKQPELDVLDVRALKVGSGQLACDTAPTFRRVIELAFKVNIGVKVVWASFVGVICDIEQ